MPRKMLSVPRVATIAGTLSTATTKPLTIPRRRPMASPMALAERRRERVVLEAEPLEHARRLGIVGHAGGIRTREHEVARADLPDHPGVAPAQPRDPLRRELRHAHEGGDEVLEPLELVEARDLEDGRRLEQ